MKSNKKLTYIIFIVLVSFLLISCNNKVVDQGLCFETIVENSQNNLLNNKEFLEQIDVFSKSKMNQYDQKILGDLNNDNIPELIIFKERDYDNLEDPGYLNLYMYDNGYYVLKDSIPMNYDNSNYEMVIGNISKDTVGLIINNQVGAHSGITYGFKLEEDRLKNIFNENKISLLSVYTFNEIKDINNDGILEFSVYTIDPETEDNSSLGSDKMTLWYRWDGKDSVDLVSIQREDIFENENDLTVFKEAKSMLKNQNTDFIDYLESNLDSLSKFDISELLISYLEDLEINNDLLSSEINNLILSKKENKSKDFIFKKYGITIDKLNNLDYILRDKILKDESDIKNHLITNISLGYLLSFNGEEYSYDINFDYFIDKFNSYLTNEAIDYLKIIGKDKNEPYLIGNKLAFDDAELTERISNIENFMLIYPYSNKIDDISHIYGDYIKLFIFGNSNNPNFKPKSFEITDDAYNNFKSTIKTYEYTRFGSILEDFLEILENNNFKLNDNARIYLDNILN